MADSSIYARPTPITSQHRLAEFSCGNSSMDSWLKKHAIHDEGRASRTYVVTVRAQVVAYYTLAVGCMTLSALPRKIRQNLPQQVPITVLGRLAVDIEHAGKGIGRALLCEAMQRTLEVAEHVGVRALVVHAIDSDAALFYEQFGFLRFPAGSLILLLPIETIAQAIDETSGSKD
ncbi:GNAT family N-acetyltransferase [Sphingomonas sp. AOB5]|uniref:GNAT family N-acetyltransferase n=1 Tax=Sphingomonas sp. AOB5 TaxID=3034017 RepID=UPI0023F8D5E7|nr:GNAT family N-acetyltransferase [Sphingomonas sp. AOB5]MDF7776296.1 GNAT family N-acetyltransferase [Sphingomonas sp. AOB5]